jgi:glycosyltransferase involved in cell wall biosynthesis
LTLNEEQNIAKCIESVDPADDVLVVDSGSTDMTIEIASATRARVVGHPFLDFADQRNYAMSLLTSEWVLHLDADERVTPELWNEIRAMLASDSCDGYLVPCLNIVFGKPLKHGGWYPQYHLRLQRRKKARWYGAVHEEAAVEGPVGKLVEPIVHFGHPNIHTFLLKLDRYTSLEASRRNQSVVLLSALAFLMPLPYFMYKYFLQLGFLDGWRGLAAAILLSFYRCVTLLKALEQRSSPTEKLTRE